MTKNIPIMANDDPRMSRRVIRSPFMQACERKAVINGAVHIIRDTFEANVYSRAVFSIKKYIDPPLIPSRSSKASSLSVAADIFLLPNIHARM